MIQNTRFLNFISQYRASQSNDITSHHWYMHAIFHAININKHVNEWDHLQQQTSIGYMSLENLTFGVDTRSRCTRDLRDFTTQTLQRQQTMGLIETGIAIFGTSVSNRHHLSQLQYNRRLRQSADNQYTHAKHIPDFLFSARSGATIRLFVRFTRNDRRRIERRNVSGIRENLPLSAGCCLRSGRKKFFTASIVILVILVTLLWWRSQSKCYALSRHCILHSFRFRRLCSISANKRNYRAWTSWDIAIIRSSTCFFCVLAMLFRQSNRD